MKRLNPDTVSPGAFNGVSARAAARQDHSRPRLAPEPAGGRAAASPARPSSEHVASGCPAHPWLDGRLDVKIKIRPEHASMLEMNDWLAELRDGENAEPTGPGNAEPTGPGNAEPTGPGNAEPTGPGPTGPAYAVPTSYAVPASPGHAEPASYVRAMSAGPGYAVQASPGYAVPPSPDCAEPAAAMPGQEAPGPGPLLQRRPSRPLPRPGPLPPLSPTRPAAPAAPAGPAGAAERAVIGDQLRMPVMWCEMGSCVSWHADPAALGEADARARAITGRLAHRRPRRAGLPQMPADRPPLLGRPPGRAVGPVHGHRRDRPAPRRAAQQP